MISPALHRWLKINLGRSRLYHHLRWIIYRKQAPIHLKKYGLAVNKENIALMKEAWLKYHWNFHEFHWYDYPKITEDKRASFVSDYDKNVFCEKANTYDANMIFHDKWETYLRFKDYYKRTVVLICKEEDLLSCDFKNFIKKNNRFIIKSVDASLGKGTEIMSVNSHTDAVSMLEPLVKKGGKYIVEELISQSKDLSDVHPSSVNTVRITTFRFDSSTDIIHPFIKFGTGGNFVDNGGKGGIICKINTDTGVIVAAVDESPRNYTHHPDTNVKLIGFKIPHWHSAIELARKLAEVVPGARYVGWDLALTDNGWVMVEGNEKGMFIGFQLPTQEGFREDFNNICKKANIKM